MGMFDSVWVQCRCGAEVEFQSKAGECALRDYTLSNVPSAIAGDLDGESMKCEKCGTVIALHSVVLISEEYR